MTTPVSALPVVDRMTVYRVEWQSAEHPGWRPCGWDCAQHITSDGHALKAAAEVFEHASDMHPGLETRAVKVESVFTWT